MCILLVCPHRLTLGSPWDICRQTLVHERGRELICGSLVVLLVTFVASCVAFGRKKEKTAKAKKASLHFFAHAENFEEGKRHFGKEQCAIDLICNHYSYGGH